MRGLTDIEHQELLALARDERERWFDGPTLDGLEVARRIERFDIDVADESYRMRPTLLGALALRLWPLLRQ